MHGKDEKCREDKFRMYVMEKGWEDVDWIHLAQDRDQWRPPVKTIMDFRVT
jgi:hypothetical protein